MKYEQDIFYDNAHLSNKQKIELFYDAKEQSYEWWVDILDCNVSVARQRIEMSFDEILDKFSDGSHFVFIHQRGYKNWGYHIETGFRTMESIDHFLFIHLKEDKLGYFVEKFKLKEM